MYPVLAPQRLAVHRFVVAAVVGVDSPVTARGKSSDSNDLLPTPDIPVIRTRFRFAQDKHPGRQPTCGPNSSARSVAISVTATAT
jgi:hypothetical protein